MNKTSKHHHLQSLALLSASMLVLSTLGACGGGPFENKSWESGSGLPGGSEQGTSTQYDEWKAAQEAEAAAAAEAQRQAEATAAAEAAAAAAAAADAEQARNLAVHMATMLQDRPADHPGEKMLVVGLDSSSRVSMNDQWLNSQQFAWLTDQDKEQMRKNFVSLAGSDLYSYYNQSCPVVSEGHDVTDIYRCLAGIYYGKNADGKMCFTSIGWDGRVRHVNDNSVVTTFKPGHVEFYGTPGSTTPAKIDPEFTRADVGGNMFMIFNGIQRSINRQAVYGMDPAQSHRTQQIVFKFDSAAKYIEIYQKNNDDDVGTGRLDSTCLVNFNGAG